MAGAEIGWRWTLPRREIIFGSRQPIREVSDLLD
jgi:hypothetical protein